MRVAGNPGSEDRKKMYAYCGFALVVIVYVYFEFFRDPSTPAVYPQQPVIVTVPAGAARPPDGGEASASSASNSVTGTSAKVVGKTSAGLDPTLHMEAMVVTESVTYGGSGRNIFSAASAPPPVMIQKAIAPARPLPTPPPPVYHDPGPPPPPPIDVKFAGYFEVPGTGEKRAILLHGDDEALAYAGQIAFRRYRLISISIRSIEVEDMQNNNKQTLPLAN